MTTYKIKYKHYIVNLYLPEQQVGKSVLIVPGLPMSTNIHELIQSFLNAGAVVYYPYFSGTFDSGGKFSAAQSIKDISAWYSLMQAPNVTELYFGKEINITVPMETVIVGMSFGAAIALLGHRNLFTKIVLLSPALLFNPKDFLDESGKDFQNQMQLLLKSLKNAYPHSYKQNIFSDLKSFLLGKKVTKNEIVLAFQKITCPTLVIQGIHDTAVPESVTKSLESDVLNPYVSWKYIEGGHSTSSYSKAAFQDLTNFVREDYLP